jgi:acyl-CoA dehydrogenase
MNEQDLQVAAPSRASLIQTAWRIGEETAGPAAAAGDAEARFPTEAFAALKAERLLGALVPTSLGGLGASIADIAAICETLGQRCANTAMIYAMHQIQVNCLVRHGASVPLIRAYLSELCEQQLLLASATTETNVGGDVRTSLCAVLRNGDRFSLEKSAPVISYAANADGILVTARRAPDAASNDQVILLARREATSLEPISTWDTLGFRGTCSLGFTLRTSGPTGEIMPEPYADISARTMLPTSHVVWTSLWLGIATDAVNRARAYIRAEARKKPGTTPPGALRLAELVSVLQTMRATVHDAVAEYARNIDDPEALSSMSFALRMNNVKIAASRLVVEVVAAAMQITGITGYRRDSKFSLERHLRDAYGAALMINNDRIYGANASILLVVKDD